MSETPKWYTSPQGIVAAATIATMILGFFYVRERQMWDNDARLQTLERRGDQAILSVNTRFERVEQVLSEQRDRINFLERKNDRIEIILKELQESRGKSYDPTAH